MNNLLIYLFGCANYPIGSKKLCHGVGPARMDKNSQYLVSVRFFPFREQTPITSIPAPQSLGRKSSVQHIAAATSWGVN